MAGTAPALCARELCPPRGEEQQSKEEEEGMAGTARALCVRERCPRPRPALQAGNPIINLKVFPDLGGMVRLSRQRSQYKWVLEYLSRYGIR